jgi:prenyltransferase beta subunit
MFFQMDVTNRLKVSEEWWQNATEIRLAFQENLEKSCDWLESIQHPNGGWGLTKSQAPSLVNTAEAISVLLKSRNKDRKLSIEKGIAFIIDNWRKHLEERGPKVRFVSFSLLALVENESIAKHSADAEQMKNWIRQHQNADGGWGAMASEESDLTATCSVIQSIVAFDASSSMLAPAKNWILGQRVNSGWPFRADQQTSINATSIALITLAKLGLVNDQRLQDSLALLRDFRHPESDEEVALAGTVWKYPTHANLVTALALHNQDIFSPSIAQAVRYSNRLINSQGGWGEQPGQQDSRSVRAQFWAATYSSALMNTFDPSKYVLRVDAERTATSLSAPAFQHFFIQSRMATVIPTSIFKFTTYSSFVIGLLASLDVGRHISLDFLQYLPYLGIMLLAGSLVAIKYRPSVFGRLNYPVTFIAIIVATADVLFDISPLDWISWIRAGLSVIGDMLAGIV